MFGIIVKIIVNLVCFGFGIFLVLQFRNIDRRLSELEKNWGCSCPRIDSANPDTKESKAWFSSWICPVHGRFEDLSYPNNHDVDVGA